MTKVFPASCTAGIVVTTDVPPKPVLDAEILSKGIGASEGFVIISGGKVYYVTGTAADLEATLGHVIDALGKVKDALDKAVDALTAIDTVAPLIVTGTAAGGLALTATAAWIPIATSNIAGVTAAASQLQTATTQLQTLKGALK